MHNFTHHTFLIHKRAFAALMACAAIFSHFSALADNTPASTSNSLVVYQFMDLDTNHDNQLSIAEAVRDWDISANFKKADFDGNGVLALTEYTNFKTALKNTRNAHHAAAGNGLVINGLIVKG